MATATYETMSTRQSLAEKLVGLTGKVRATKEEYHKIYGPGVSVIPKGTKVKILYSKVNHKNPENPNGDIWCRVRAIGQYLEMWIPSTFMVVKDDN